MVAGRGRSDTGRPTEPPTSTTPYCQRLTLTSHKLTCPRAAVRLPKPEKDWPPDETHWHCCTQQAEPVSADTKLHNLMYLRCQKNA